jgi:hypothetical protein
VAASVIGVAAQIGGFTMEPEVAGPAGLRNQSGPLPPGRS